MTLPKEPDLILTIPGDVPNCVLEMVRAILGRRVNIGSYPAPNFQIVIDYAPGDVKVIVGKMTVPLDNEK